MICFFNFRMNDDDDDSLSAQLPWLETLHLHNNHIKGIPNQVRTKGGQGGVALWGEKNPDFLKAKVIITSAAMAEVSLGLTNSDLQAGNAVSNIHSPLSHLDVS